MWRWAKMPIRITGAIASMAGGGHRDHCVCSTEMKLNMATVTRPDPVAAQHDGEHEFVPGIEKHEDGGDGEAAADLRQDHVPERAQPARAVEQGGFLHLERHVLDRRRMSQMAKGSEKVR